MSPVWAPLLLALYVALGVSRRATWRRASRLACILSGIVLLVVFASYGAVR